MNDCLITIFTPAYNRKNMLVNLYKSLLNQTNKNFEWLIIDDGSSDDTDKLIKKFINENIIKIRYFYKQNEGKPAAINEGLDKANGKLFFIVDSDDYLTDNAIDVIKKYYDEIKDLDDFIGICGLRGKDKNTPYTAYYGKKNKKNRYLNKEYIDCTSIEYRYKYKISGDRAEVLITEKAKKYKFPHIDNEKFITESYLWYKISNDGYKFRFFNEIIYIGCYHQDGLSQNMKDILRKNPKGVKLSCNEFLTYKEITFIPKLKFAVNYYRYGIITEKKYKALYKECNDKIISIIAIPIAIIKKIK